MPDLTCAEFGRRYGVTRSTVKRALERGAEIHRADPACPAPPAAVNPGEPQLRYPSEEMDAWWSRRRRWVHKRAAGRAGGGGVEKAAGG